ncbi:LysR family transcriptional regulator [Corynebacterium atypicum]|uniref:LysR family transcriptional regulator n=1 Tax=Corynebacterium atypicum TaxID=191610 RepID=UPI00068ED8E8|nr:LysR family transcriptional regulator [Corynebacterium atypicum]
MTSDDDVTAMRLITLVERLGSISKAAAALGMAQSNASRTLARYERITGLRLINRSSSGSALTTSGVTAASWARKALHELDNYRAALDALARSTRATLAVGASQTIAEYLAPQASGGRGQPRGRKLADDPREGGKR